MDNKEVLKIFLFIASCIGALGLKSLSAVTFTVNGMV
jgi:hypothetical protein